MKKALKRMALHLAWNIDTAMHKIIQRLDPLSDDKIRDALDAAGSQRQDKDPKMVEDLKRLWAEFSDVPIDDDDNIQKDFLGFKAGTDRFEVWRWFDSKCPNGLRKDLFGADYEKED